MSRSPIATRGRSEGRVGALARRYALAPIMIGVVLYSIGPVFVRASDVSGPVFSFWRLWFGVAVFAAAAAVQASWRGPLQVTWRSLRWPVWAGLAFGGHQLMMFTAVKWTTVADVTLIGATSPIVTALLAVPIFDERPGPRFHAWSTMAMIGSAVVVVGGATGPSGNLPGMLLALGNVVFFAIFFLLSKRSRTDIGVLPFLTGVMAVAALVVTGFVTVTGAPVAAGARDLVYAGIVAAGPGFLGHVAMTWPLRWIPANVPPVMRLGQPILASTWAWIFLGDAIGVTHVVGGLIVVIGVAGAVQSRGGRALMQDAQREGSTSDPLTDP